MGSVGREMEILRKSQEESLQIKTKKKKVTEMKNALNGVLVDWTWLMKESLS